MRRVEVEARDDVDHLDGGHAVILVQGIEHLDDSITFFLRPLDATFDEDGIGSLEHEQRAVSVRSVPGGVELGVGPDVTEHTALAAGSSVEIEIPDAGVWSEFQWPAVTPRARPRRAKIVANHPPAAEFEPDIGATHAAGPPRPQPIEKKKIGKQPMEKPPIGVRTTVIGTANDVNVGNTTNTRLAQAAPEIDFTAVHSNATVQKETISMAIPHNVENGPASGIENATPGPGTPEGQEYVVFYPYARGGQLGSAGSGARARRSASLLPTTRMGAAATAVAAVLALQTIAWISGGWHISQANSSAASGASVGADMSPYELFAAGPVSPRGVQAREITPAKSLENAQAALLTPGAPRDSEEASYWLRRFITSSGSDERTRRVLTQLGTTFADPTSQVAEYGKARQVWELASAFGDPVAMCFLGTLHENGLGVATDRKAALQWYERAKQTGGCPAVDEAITRLKK